MLHTKCLLFAVPQWPSPGGRGQHRPRSLGHSLPASLPATESTLLRRVPGSAFLSSIPVPSRAAKPRRSLTWPTSDRAASTPCPWYLRVLTEMQYFHMRPHTAPPSPFMPGSVRCSGWGGGWGGGLATALDPGPPPSQGMALVLSSQVTSFFMRMKKQKVQRQGEGRP